MGLLQSLLIFSHLTVSLYWTFRGPLSTFPTQISQLTRFSSRKTSCALHRLSVTYVSKAHSGMFSLHFPASFQVIRILRIGILPCLSGSSNGDLLGTSSPPVRFSHQVLMFSLHVALLRIVLQQQRTNPVAPVPNIVVITHKVLCFSFNLSFSHYFQWFRFCLSVRSPCLMGRLQT